MRNHQEPQQDQDQEPMDFKKNPNLETTTNHHIVLPSPPSSSQDFKINHLHIPKRAHEDEGFIFKKPNSRSCSSLVAAEGYMPPPQDLKKPNSVSCSSVAAGEGDMTTPPVEESGRERLKRHRVEMAGRVWIPDIWGHEDLLKDWIDCTVFDSSLGNNTIMSARAALIQEGRSTVRIENKC